MTTPAAVAAAIQSNTGDPNAAVRHSGVVQSIQTTTITCTIDGGSTPVPGIQFDASYVPQVQDIISIIRTGTLWVAEGVLPSSTSVGATFTPGDVKTTEIAGDEPGWLVEDGRSMLIASYQALSAVIRPTYGGADSSHFYLPNRSGKYLVGADGSSYILGTSGGSTTIAAGNLPSTSPWTVHDPGHGHSIGSGFILGTGGSGSNSVGGSGAHADSIVAIGTGVSMNSNTAGGGTAYNPPFLPIYYKVKT